MIDVSALRMLLLTVTSRLGRQEREILAYRILGGQLKTGNLWTGQNRQFPGAAETSEFYFVRSSVCKSVCSFVRQLRGPHFSTWA